MSQLTIQQALKLALQHHQAGRLQEAEGIYRQILAQQPNHAEATHLLGVIAQQVGQYDAAVNLIRHAIALNPNYAEAYSNLSNALRDAGRLNEAIEAGRQAIALKPNYPDAFNNLGTALKDNGQLPEAVAAFRQAIALKANSPEVHSNLGNALREIGQLDESIAACRQAIALRPDYAAAYNNLGNALSEKKSLDEAAAAFQQAIALMPTLADAHNNLGYILQEQGDVDKAIAAHRQAIALRPNYAEAYSNLGNALREKESLDDAIAACRHAISLKPDLPAAHNNLGIALKSKGCLDEAVLECRQAIALKPSYAEAHNNLGNALSEMKQLHEAIAAYRQAIDLKPDYTEAYNNLGNVLADTEHLDEAIAAHRHAIALKPDYAEAYSNLGNALKNQGHLPEAIAAYRQAIPIKPDYAGVYNNLGNALGDTDHLDEAIAAHRHAIALRPTYAEAYNNLGNALKNQGYLDKAIAAYREALALKPSYTEACDNLILSLHYHPDFNAQALAHELNHWNLQYAQPLKKFQTPHPNDRNPNRPLRIGYVSPDFRSHSVARFFLPLIASHDPSTFQIFCYSHVPSPDAMTTQLQAHAHAWRNIVGYSDEQVAKTIREDQIDILVDLAMHTAHNRLLVFARKPAPIQVTYLAYAGGTALDAIDYRLTDRHLDPNQADDRHYMEKSLRLDGTYWCYQPPANSPPVNSLPTLHTGQITFGCLNNFCKITPPVLETWAALLQKLPNARLLLHSPAGSHRNQLRQWMQNRNIAPDRLEFVGRISFDDYLKTYHRIDIALDSFPFAGGTTTCDALWLGVPVITLAGHTAVGRAGVSILSNLNLPELIAHTPQEYIQIAATLAQDLSRLQTLRATLRQKMQKSPLMNAPLFAQNIESAYRSIWQKWCAAPPH